MNRRGFSLVEVVVAMTLLGVALSALVRPTFQYAQRVTDLQAEVQRDGVARAQVSRLMALPYDSLASRAGCRTVSTTALPHTRCVTLTSLSTTQTRVSVIITPSNTTFAPDTVTFERTRMASGNPFNS